MEFFNSAVTTLQTIVVGLGGALCVWAVSICWRGTGRITRLPMLMCGKVTHKNLIDNRPLFRYYSSIWIEKTSLIQYNKVSGRYLYEGKNTNH